MATTTIKLPLKCVTPPPGDSTGPTITPPGGFTVFSSFKITLAADGSPIVEIVLSDT